MNWLNLVIILGWTWAVAFAAYKVGYSEGHNDATIYSVRQSMESALGDTSDSTGETDS